MNCLGKGYKIRGCAYKKLGMWCEAHADLQTGLRLDFDEGIEAEVAAKAKELQAAAVSKRVKQEEEDSYWRMNAFQTLPL